jgi:hypothetical protein
VGDVRVRFLSVVWGVCASYPFIDASTEASKRRRSSTRKKKKTLITTPLKASYTLANYPNAKLY